MYVFRNVYLVDFLDYHLSSFMELISTSRTGVSQNLVGESKHNFNHFGTLPDRDRTYLILPILSLIGTLVSGMNIRLTLLVPTYVFPSSLSFYALFYVLYSTRCTFLVCG